MSTCEYAPGDPMFYAQRGCDAPAVVTLWTRQYHEQTWTRHGDYCARCARITAYRRHGDIPGGWHYSGRVRYVRITDGRDVRPTRRSFEPTDQYGQELATV